MIRYFKLRNDFDFFFIIDMAPLQGGIRPNGEDTTMNE